MVNGVLLLSRVTMEEVEEGEEVVVEVDEEEALDAAGVAASFAAMWRSRRTPCLTCELSMAFDEFEVVEIFEARSEKPKPKRS